MLAYSNPTALPLPGEPLPMLATQLPAIVVVDDEPSLLTIFHRVLRTVAHQHALMAVSTGAAALELLDMGPIALLITDYNMPGMSGLELIETVKRRSPATPTVLITAYDSPDIRRRARAARVDYYLAKPFPLDRLEEIVHATVL